jgi:hypothetical protein
MDTVLVTRLTVERLERIAPQGLKPTYFGEWHSARVNSCPRKKQKRESDKTNDLTNWRVGVNGLVSSIEVGITGGGLIQNRFRFVLSQVRKSGPEAPDMGGLQAFQEQPQVTT